MLKKAIVEKNRNNNAHIYNIFNDHIYISWLQ